MTTASGPEAAASVVLAAARAALGRDVELAGRPQVSVRDGWGAYTCALAGEATSPEATGQPEATRTEAAGPEVPGPEATGPEKAADATDATGAAEVGDASGLPAPWDGPLVVRILPDATTGAAAIAREVAWHTLVTASGFRVPAVLSHIADEPGPAVVTVGGPERSLLECVEHDRARAPRFVALMGDLHARLHALPVDGAPEDVGAGPLDDLAGLLAASGIADGHFAAELEALRPDERGGGPPVVCHGGFQLSSVRLDPANPAGALVANWSAARLAEREYDVAQTLLTFWSLPYLAAGRARRRALRAVRDALIESYRSAYESRAPLDPDRMRYWEAFHALASSARMAAEDGAPAPDPWDPTAVIAFRESYRKDLTRRFVGLTRD